MKRKVSETVTVPDILGILMSVRDMTRIVTALSNSHSTLGFVLTTCSNEKRNVPSPADVTISMKSLVRAVSGFPGIRSILLLRKAI